MKIYFILNSEDDSSSQAAHKGIQGRCRNAKAATHRYERRKIRELLRHGFDDEPDLALQRGG
jgi:hypothetical protein